MVQFEANKSESIISHFCLLLPLILYFPLLPDEINVRKLAIKIYQT
jgi:hypothetical protein